MFAGRFAVCRLLGVDLRLDLGCIAVAALLAWMLATGLFPERHSELAASTYWTMGILASLGLFASVLLHELGHTSVAQRLGIPVDGITLFVFGGVAEMFEEPKTPRDELMMAAAGPLMSLLLACFFLGLVLSRAELGLSVPLVGVFEYLGVMNLVLVAFNVLPAFPLDGGRMLRAVLWSWRKSQARATRIATLCGSAFAWIFATVGILHLLDGDPLAGTWWVVIAVFIRATSANAYRQFLAHHDELALPVG